MSNPIISRGFSDSNSFASENPMTISGTINKLFLMFVLLCTSFGIVFYQYGLGYLDKVNLLMKIGLLGGFIIAMVVIFTRKAMGVLVPVYAFLEGMALGGISAIANSMIPGIPFQAVAATFMTLFAMLILYKTGTIKATEKFKGIVATATLGIFLFYLISFVLSFFNVPILAQYASSVSPLAIGINAVFCIVAALNLILDFHSIELGESTGIDKENEWYGAFGLMVTLVWLYIEVLNLLSRLSRND